MCKMKKHNERSKIENYEILWFNRHQTPIKKVTELFADPKNLKEYQMDLSGKNR